MYLQKSDDGPDYTHELSGTVTKVSWDCGHGKSIKDGSPVKMPCPTDTGEYVLVDDKKVVSDPGFVGEKDSFKYDHELPHTVKPGDKVYIRAVLDEHGRYTLNCESCSVEEVR